MGKKNKVNMKGSGNKKRSEKDVKPKIDERFQAMFTDKNFKLKYVTDKRGLPITHSSSTDLKEFYSLTTSGSESNDIEDASDASSESEHKSAVISEGIQEKKPDKLKKSKVANGKMDIENNSEIEESPSESSIDEDEGSDDENEHVSVGDSNETSSDTSEGEDDQDDGEIDHKWQEWDENAPVASEITKRLSLCNMDWDRIRVEDILAVFNSFKPASGIIYSVKIYPSEFGFQRMEEEKLKGPAELVEQTAESDDDGHKEGSKYHREKLRQYQLNRLKYYYAVIECDSPETADSLYEQLNGMEYESSAVCMDLRFIPDDVTFEQEPKWVASSVSDPSEYKPRLFTNSALQQVKVNLTWDETDPKRRETLKKAFTDPESIEKDIKNYLASSSGSEDEDLISVESVNSDRQIKMNERISKYKDLLQSIEEKEKEKKENKFEMEISWEPGLKMKTEEIVKEKIEKETLTPFEEILKKKKEDKKQKKKERRTLFNKEETNSSDNGNDEFGNVSSDEPEKMPANDQSKNYLFKHNKSNKSNHEDNNKMAEELSLLVSESEREKVDRADCHGKKKKAKVPKTDNFEMNVTDSRFSAIYTSHHYNIDPSNPHYKDSKGMRAVVEEKQKKRKVGITDLNSPRTQSKKYHQDPDEEEIGDSVVLI